MALQLQDGTSLQLQNGDDLLLQADVLGAAPTITVQPLSQTVVDEDVVSFLVAGTSISGPITYQWYNTGGILVGETSDSYIFITDIGDDAEEYYCILTNDFGSTQSDNAVLTVTEIPITITVQPVPASVVEEQDATYTIAATGKMPISYQWYEVTEGLLSGEASDTLVITTEYADNGNQYYCVVSDGYEL